MRVLISKKMFFLGGFLESWRIVVKFVKIIRKYKRDGTKI